MPRNFLAAGFFSLFLSLTLIPFKTGGMITQDIPYWNWEEINIHQPNFLESLSFPDEFVWGIADSAYQVEGPYAGPGKMAQNTWTELEKKPGAIKKGHTIGDACDRWNRYKEDIALMRECGFKSYRFSIEWSKVEPEKGVFDPEALQHYIDVVDELLANEIEPVICLFHHTWPLWFDKEGGWERSENIAYFVEFALYVFEALHERAHTWMTLNEPAAYAMGGFFIGNVPPCKKDLLLCGKVLKNFLDAHIACYKAMKRINSQVAIGFCHVVPLLDPYHAGSSVEEWITRSMDHLVNGVTLEYFKTGHFNWTYPAIIEFFAIQKLKLCSMLKNGSFSISYTAYNPDAPECLDYIGVNYYAHVNFSFDIKKGEFGAQLPRADKDELTSTNGYFIYPEGIYRAIEKCSVLGIPMHIAENGVADNNDEFKQNFIKSHLYAVSKAIADGYNVQGYYYWTLMDNWEWDQGYTQKFGLFAVDRQTQERTLYPGAQEFIEFVQKKAQ